MWPFKRKKLNLGDWESEEKALREFIAHEVANGASPVNEELLSHILAKGKSDYFKNHQP